MADLWRDFWIRETGTGQQVAQLHDRYDDDDDDTNIWKQDAFTLMKGIPLCFYKCTGKKTAAKHNCICVVGRSHRGVIIEQIFFTARTLKMGPISCPKTSVTNYQSTLRNIPEGRRCHKYNYCMKILC
jgi:hypothetical protein